jgi:hypothetical protein
MREQVAELSPRLGHAPGIRAFVPKKIDLLECPRIEGIVPTRGRKDVGGLAGATEPPEERSFQD